MTSSNLLIEVRDLRVDFKLFEGEVHALEGVDFDIKLGRSLGVIGESGCGKSVTAQSIMRIMPSPPGKIVDGQILLYGADGNTTNLLGLEASGRQMRRIRWKDIAMIFQEPMTSFSPMYTIGRQIIEGIEIHMPELGQKPTRERAIDMLAKVGIPQPKRLIDVYPHQLSGGMRQRAMIAMALSCSPRLLIADEPTTALDVTIEAQILELLKSLQAEFGMRMMYISHDLAVVGEMADEIMVMYLGQVMERATTDELFAEPLHPYTKALWRSIPRIDVNQDRLVPIAGALPSPFTKQSGCPFVSRCEQKIDGLCDQQRPPMIEITKTHQVSCFLYQDQPAQLIATPDIPVHTKTS